MIIWNACYPITYEKKINKINCSKNNVNINIRLYNIDDENFFKGKIEEDPYMLNSDAWRDIKYYEYIRDYVIKTKRSPNFVISYCYYFGNNNMIDFDKINKLKIDSDKKKSKPKSKFDNDIKKYIIGSKYLEEYRRKTDIKNITKGKKNYNNNNCIIALTESPTHNFYNWTDKTYEYNYGPIKTMVQTGYHSDSEWLSIIF
jgi:hypothetical protein